MAGHDARRREPCVGDRDHGGALGQERRARAAGEPSTACPLRELHRQPGRRGEARDGADGAARAVYERTDRAVAHAEGLGDLLPRVAVELRQHERLALVLRQRGDEREHPSRLRSRLRLPLGRARCRDGLGQIRAGAAVGEDTQRAAVGGDVEPRAQLSDLRPRAQRGPSREERLLDRIARAGLADDARAAARELRPVAAHDLLEGGWVPGPAQRDEPVVGLGAEENGGKGAHGRVAEASAAGRPRASPPALLARTGKRDAVARGRARACSRRSRRRRRRRGRPPARAARRGARPRRGRRSRAPSRGRRSSPERRHREVRS